MLEFLKELLAFMRERRKLWLLPLVVVLLLLGALMIFAETSTISPFIYSLF